MSVTGKASTMTALDDLPDHFFRSGQALRYLRHYLPQSRHVTRIGVGFFTVRGYNLIRRSLAAPRTAILVGLDEPGPERVREALLDEILRDLRVGVDAGRRQAVEDLVARLEAGGLAIIDARAIGHHAKLYLVDDLLVIVGSFNLTGRGLLETIEAGEVVWRPEAVASHTADFEGYFAEGVDITGPLLEALKRWLALASPWQVYLKTLLALERLEATRLQQARPSYQRPTEFQRAVIARAMRQLEAFGGAMVVASTGLGKTTIGTDVALRLHERGAIRNVLVIAPAAVEETWLTYFERAGLSARVFTHAVFDRTPPPESSGKIQAALDILDRMDSQWLVLIDESHELRNRFQWEFSSGKPAKRERLAVTRLTEAVAQRRCKVLLLTGTPYATEVENLNHQLHLLPHTGPSRPQEGKLTLPGLEGFFPDINAWGIEELDDFRDLAVGSVITTPYVAKYFGQRDAEGNVSVDFRGQRRYLPKIVLERVDVPVLLEGPVVKLIDSGLLKVKVNPKLFHIPEWQEHAMIKQTRIERTVRVAWGSSPWALRDVLRKLDRGGYRSEMAEPEEVIRGTVAPILESLEQMSWADDAKLIRLSELLTELHAAGERAIIFSEQQATVVYLEQALAELQPGLRSASLVRQTATGRYELLGAKQANAKIAAFAPRANGKAGPPAYDVLLTTDAYGVGVNIQDARVVINYDLAWTPIEPAQRAGRVLRFREEPATVRLLTCHAVPDPAVNYGPRARGIIRRQETLMARDRAAASLLNLAMVPGAGQATIDMDTLAPARTQELDLDTLDNEVLGVSAVFDHLAQLARHRDEAEALPDDIVSARAYRGKHAMVFMLLEHQGIPELALYDLARRQLLHLRTETEALDVIACAPEMQKAMIEAAAIEAAGDACLRAWCRQRACQEADVARLATLYLQPEGQEPTIEAWLREAMQDA